MLVLMALALCRGCRGIALRHETFIG